jgi:hypothetical protein
MPLGRAAHEAVARDLGKHRRARDRGALRVAPDDRTLCDAEVGDTEAVDQADRVRRRNADQRLAQSGEVGAVSPRASMPRTQRDTITALAAARITSG